MGAFLILLVGTVLAAGCAGKPSDAKPLVSSGPTVAPPPTVGADQGAIKGAVVDDELVPIPGARVAVLDKGLEVSADSFGAFVFSGLDPGGYRLVATQIGYNASQPKPVSVQAGDITQVTLVLVALPKPGPWVQVFSVEHAADTAHGAWVGGTGVTTGGTLYSIETKDRTDALQNIQLYMSWTAGASVVPAGRNVSIGVTGHYTYRTSDPYSLCGAEGRSPVKCVVTKAQIEKGYDGTIAQCTVERCVFQAIHRGRQNQPSGETVTVTLDLQQRGTFWASLFYYAPMPDGYSPAAPG